MYTLVILFLCQSDDLIKQLGSSNFETREKATLLLILKDDLSSIRQVEKGLKSKDWEIRRRCLSIADAFYNFDKGLIDYPNILNICGPCTALDGHPDIIDYNLSFPMILVARYFIKRAPENNSYYATYLFLCTLKRLGLGRSEVQMVITRMSEREEDFKKQYHENLRHKMPNFPWPIFIR